MADGDRPCAFHASALGVVAGTRAAFCCASVLHAPQPSPLQPRLGGTRQKPRRGAGKSEAASIPWLRKGNLFVWQAEDPARMRASRLFLRRRMEGGGRHSRQRACIKWWRCDSGDEKGYTVTTTRRIGTPREQGWRMRRRDDGGGYTVDEKPYHILTFAAALCSGSGIWIWRSRPQWPRRGWRTFPLHCCDKHGGQNEALLA